MNKGKAPFYIALASCLFLLASCGGNGKKDSIYICTVQTEYWTSESGPIPKDLTGNYTLAGFDWDFYTAIGNYIKTLTETDFESYAGTMSIYVLTADQSYAITGTANLTGRWYIYLPEQSYTVTKGSVTWADATTGIVVFDGAQISFSVTGDQLSLIYPLGCFLLEDVSQEEPPPQPAEAGPERPAAGEGRPGWEPLVSE